MLVDYWLARHARDWRELIELSENGIVAAQRTEDKHAEALLRWRIADVRLFCRQEEAAALTQSNTATIRGHEDAALAALKAAEILLVDLNRWKETGEVRAMIATTYQLQNRLGEANCYFREAVSAFQRAEASAYDGRRLA